MMEAEDCIRGDPEQTKSPITTETEKDKTDPAGTTADAGTAEAAGPKGKPEMDKSPTGSQRDKPEETTDGQQTTEGKKTAYE